LVETPKETGDKLLNKINLKACKLKCNEFFLHKEIAKLTFTYSICHALRDFSKTSLRSFVMSRVTSEYLTWAIMCHSWHHKLLSVI